MINAGVFLLAEIVAQAVGLGLDIATFGAAFWGAIIMALVSWILGPITGLLSAPALTLAGSGAVGVAEPCTG